MNKEVEEAKEWLNKIVKLNKSDNIKNSYAEILLNYIQELEYDNNWHNEETIALNNRIMDLEESIHKERELAEAQTTYEVNEMWKQKIRDKIEEIKKSNPHQDEEWDGTDYIVTSEECYAIEMLQELLNEEE